MKYFKQYKAQQEVVEGKDIANGSEHVEGKDAVNGSEHVENVEVNGESKA
jgi:hypothetical protein